MQTTEIKLINDFHNTSTVIRVKPDWNQYATLTAEQVKRIRRALCGIKNCACSNLLGIRGHQTDIDYYSQIGDGSYNIRLSQGEQR
jgi:hypothetical protein